MSVLNRRTKLCCDNDLACRCSACEKRARVLGRHSGLELVLKALGSPYLRPREPSSREPERKKSRQEGLRSASLFSSSAAPAKPTLGRHTRQLHTRMNSSRLPFVEDRRSPRRRSRSPPCTYYNNRRSSSHDRRRSRSPPRGPRPADRPDPSRPLPSR